MKTISIRELQKQIKECVDTAQREQVVLTRHGQPVVMLIGCEGYDWEDLVRMTDSDFWKMIEERRRGSRTISAAEMRKRLGMNERAKRPRRKSG